MAPTALKFTVLLIFAAASEVLANPSLPLPPWLRADEQQYVEEQQFAEEQQIVDQQKMRPPWLDNNLVRVMEVMKQEVQPRCNTKFVPTSYGNLIQTICQQTATQCGSVSLITPYTSVFANLCKRG